MNIGIKTLAIVAIAAIVATGVVYAAASLLAATPGALSSIYTQSAAAALKGEKYATAIAPALITIVEA